MKIITLSRIGSNHPSQANWSYGIWKLDLINTDKTYCMSYTLKENFGGDSRLRGKYPQIIQTKDVYTSTGTPTITGISDMLDMEGKEINGFILK